MYFRAANIFRAKLIPGEKLFWAANYFRLANYPRETNCVL